MTKTVVPIEASDFSLRPLNDAIHSLERAIEQDKNEFTRDSVVQRFEYTFELSWKTLKRYFGTFQEIEVFNIPEILRKAGRQNLIDDVELWLSFHRGRNQTSHVYSENVAESVYDLAVLFAPEVKKLYQRLKEELFKIDGDDKH